MISIDVVFLLLGVSVCRLQERMCLKAKGNAKGTRTDTTHTIALWTRYNNNKNIEPEQPKYSQKST